MQRALINDIGLTTRTLSLLLLTSTIRCLIALAANKSWPIYQLDVNNVFLHGDLFEEVFMKVLEGVSNPGNKVCKLRKSIYGLKQASREWFAKLLFNLKDQDFVQSKNDYSLFIKHIGDLVCRDEVYVDDVILTRTDSQGITQLKTHFHSEFGSKDLGALNYFFRH